MVVDTGCVPIGSAVILIYISGSHILPAADCVLPADSKRVAFWRLPQDITLECGKSGATRSRGRYSPADHTVIPSEDSDADGISFEVSSGCWCMVF